MHTWFSYCHQIIATHTHVSSRFHPACFKSSVKYCTTPQNLRCSVCMCNAPKSDMTSLLATWNKTHVHSRTHIIKRQLSKTITLCGWHWLYNMFFSAYSKVDGQAYLRVAAWSRSVLWRSLSPASYQWPDFSGRLPFRQSLERTPYWNSLFSVSLPFNILNSTACTLPQIDLSKKTCLLSLRSNDHASTIALLWLSTFA